MFPTWSPLGQAPVAAEISKRLMGAAPGIDRKVSCSFSLAKMDPLVTKIPRLKNMDKV
jgi:hypothetical protein